MHFEQDARLPAVSCCNKCLHAWVPPERIAGPPAGLEHHLHSQWTVPRILLVNLLSLCSACAETSHVPQGLCLIWRANRHRFLEFVIFLLCVPMVSLHEKMYGRCMWSPPPPQAALRWRGVRCGVVPRPCVARVDAAACAQPGVPAVPVILLRFNALYCSSDCVAGASCVHHLTVGVAMRIRNVNPKLSTPLAIGARESMLHAQPRDKILRLYRSEPQRRCTQARWERAALALQAGSGPMQASSWPLVHGMGTTGCEVALVN